MRLYNLTFFILLSTHFFGQTWKDQKIEAYFLDNNFSEAKNYIEERLGSTPQLNSEQTAYYLSALSHSYLRVGQFGKALDLAKKSIQVSRPSTDKLLKSETWRAMAFAYLRTSELDSALVYANKMYRYGKESGNYDFTRAASMAMGNISMQQEKFENALQFYTDVLDLTTKNKIQANLKVDYYNVGLALSRLKKIEASNLYLEKALQKANIANDEILLARIYGSLLDNYSRLNNNVKRIYYQEKANLIAKKQNNHQLLAMGYSNMMQWSLNENNPTKAIEYGRESINYLKKFPIKQLEMRVDSLMYAALKKIKRNDEALQYLESFTKKKKRIVSSENTKNLNELIVKYDVENKILKIKNQQNELVIARKERNIYMLIMGVLFVLLSSIILLKYNQKIYKKILFKKDKYYDNLFNQTKKLLDTKHPIETNNNAMNVENSDTKSEYLFNKLIATIEQDQLYLNPDLDQKTLIRILGTNKKYLYEAIKYHGESNFRGIINRLRINRAKKIIADQLSNGQTVAINTLYLESGFNANSTFYRIFKAYTGLSPVEYSAEYKNEILKNKHRKTKDSSK
jgi:AraC-like DNA-binding protein